MLTVPLPKTAFNFASALMLRRFLLSWRPLRLMYAHNFFTTCVRGSGLDPTTSAKAALGVKGFMKAAFGLRFVPAFLVAFLAVRLVVLAFLVAFFFLVAI